MEDPPKYSEVAVIFGRLLSELGLSGNQLAKSLGTSQQVVSGYTSGRRNPGREMIAAIIKRYPAINAVWLVTGQGDPFPGGVFNQKPVLAPVALTSGAATIEAATSVMLQEQMQLRITERNTVIERQQQEIERLWDMLGKSPGSSDAAGYFLPPPAPLPHVPVTGFVLSVQTRRKGRVSARK